jgi:hypothetical protein
VFNNIDGSGNVGCSIFNTEPIREPSSEQPVELIWQVQRGEIFVNPQGQFSKDISGNCTPLVGTYREWFFRVAVDGVAQDVCRYLLPVEYGDRISSWQPFVLHQEFFGADTGRMGNVLTEARFYDFAVTDSQGNVFPVNKWQSAGRIDGHDPVAWAAKDKRFGWYADGKYLVSRSGHDDDVVLCNREIGTVFTVETIPEPIPGDANNDRAVDDDDASILGAHWLQAVSGGFGDGDFNGDGNVNDADAAILAAHWHEGVGEGTVPEPGSLALLAGIAVMGMIYLRRRCPCGNRV